MALATFDWEAVLAKGKPAGYNGGPIVTTPGQPITPELQAALDYNKALRYQSSAQERQGAEQQYGAGGFVMTQAGAIPKTGVFGPTPAPDTSGFVIGGVPVGTGTMAAYDATQAAKAAQPGVAKPTGAQPVQTNLFGAAQTAVTGAPAAQTAVTGAPAAHTVDGRSLMQTQLRDILASGSPLMTQAATRAAQMANARGLANSSMAAGAAQGALMDRALPIAQHDAGEFSRSGFFNAEQKNLFAREGLDRQWRSGEAAADRAWRSSEREAGEKSQLSQEYRAKSQASYDAYISEVQRLNESDMDPDVKAAQVANLKTLFESRQSYLNTVYKFAPQWQSEWAQFALEFGGA